MTPRPFYLSFYHRKLMELLIISDAYTVCVLHCEQFLKISLFSCDPPAFFKQQFKSKTAVGNPPIKKGLPHIAGNTAVLFDTSHNFRRQIRLIGVPRPSAAISVCIRNLYEHAENIDFIRVSQNIRKRPCLRIQPVRKGKFVVLTDCGFSSFWPAFGQ